MVVYARRKFLLVPQALPVEFQAFPVPDEWAVAWSDRVRA